MILVAALAASFESCGMDMYAESVNPGECTSSHDCEGDEYCDPGSHTCSPGFSVDLVVEVKPFNAEQGSGYLPDQYRLLQGEAGTINTTLVLAPSWRVSGTVYRSPEGTDGVSARIEFDPASETFPDTLRGVVSASTSEDPGSSGRFEAWLQPGTYETTVFPKSPDSETLPPLYLEPLVVGTDGGATLNISYPDDLRTISGTMLLANGDPVPHDLTIWAVDVATSRRVSTTAATTSGAFSLVMSPTADEVALRVAPGDGASAAGYPSISFGPWILVEMATDDYGNVDLDASPEPLVQLPLLGDLVLYKAKVEGEEAGIAEPLQDVTVSFQAEREGAVFETLAVTNASGEICTQNSDGEPAWGVMLRENDYTVTITPPSGGKYESLVVPLVRVSYTGDGIQMGQVFQLGLKPPLVGSVFMATTGEPLEGLAVEAYPVSPVPPTEEGYPVPRFGTGESGPGGMFRIDLDSGLYDVLVRSGSASGLAWIWKDNVSPGGDDLVEFAAKEPLTIEGRVVYSDSTAASDALVQIYHHVPPVGGEEHLTRLVWETTTGSAGTYRILLSPDLAD